MESGLLLYVLRVHIKGVDGAGVFFCQDCDITVPKVYSLPLLLEGVGELSCCEPYVFGFSSCSVSREPSSIFIYAFPEHFGGPTRLFKDFFLPAVSPLGFVKDGRNFNFYDAPDLFRAARPFIVRSIPAQMAPGVSTEVAIVLGTGKNKETLERLNEKFGFFKTLLALEHPRFIVQYRRSKFGEYIRKYEETFLLALGQSHV